MKFYKKIVTKIFLISAIIFGCVAVFGGCAVQSCGYKIKSLPNKIIYQIGEKPNFDGLKIQAINTNGNYQNLRFDAEDINSVDTSSAGVKKVIVKKGGFEISFDIYVANIVANDSDNLKKIFAEANAGDVVYLRKGNYIPKNAQDTNFADVEISKPLTIVGDGNTKTNFGGNFIVGAKVQQGSYQKIDNFDGVKFIGINFLTNTSTKNNVVQWGNSTYQNGAIRCFDTQNLSVINCNFCGYAFGILGDNANGLVVKNCRFKNILKNGIKISTSTKNSTIVQNQFLDIATNIVAFDGDEPARLCAIYLGFANAGQCGVAVCKNIFVRIGIANGNLVYFDDESKNKANAYTSRLQQMAYLKNSSALVLVSTSLNDLRIDGLILASNTYSGCLQTAYMGKTGKTTINTAGITFIAG